MHPARKCMPLLSGMLPGQKCLDGSNTLTHLHHVFPQFPNIVFHFRLALGKIVLHFLLPITLHPFSCLAGCYRQKRPIPGRLRAISSLSSPPDKLMRCDPRSLMPLHLALHLTNLQTKIRIHSPFFRIPVPNLCRERVCNPGRDGVTSWENAGPFGEARIRHGLGQASNLSRGCRCRQPDPTLANRSTSASQPCRGRFARSK